MVRGFHVTLGIIRYDLPCVWPAAAIVLFCRGLLREKIETSSTCGFKLATACYC